ncbi:IS sequence [Rhodococcus ruber BKS 20-38]|uniref:IS sequence n=1 Tax=Rhodococcus ruber BKS 20-38 TaxID=1278076 RepID=M2ZS02_9NOCA|nr:IS sequence [Rhodococcus ruber BKS 20-38]
MPIRIAWAPGRGHWLLARRSLSDPTEIAYYICAGSRRTTLVELATVADSRWRVEDCFQQAKSEAGLDQVRTYRAWYAHTTLSILALPWLAGTKTEAIKGESETSTRS